MALEEGGWEGREGGWGERGKGGRAEGGEQEGRERYKLKKE